MARKNALVIALGFLGVVAAAVAVPFGWQVVGIAVAAFAVPAILFIGVKYPIVALMLYAALIPFEDAVQVAGLGTLAKAAGLVFAGCYVLARGSKISFRTMPLPLWLWVAWSFLSLLWSINRDSSLFSLWMFAQQLVMAVLVADIVSSDIKVVSKVLWPYAVASVVTSVIGLLSGALSDLTRAAAFQGQDQAMFAAALIPGFLFLLWRAMDREVSAVGRLLSVLLLLVPLTAIIASGTRSAWVGILVGSIALLASQAKRGLVTTLGFVAVGLYLVLAQIPQLSDFMLDRLGTAVSSGGAGRVDIWRVGLTIFQDSPIFGVGAGNFPDAFTLDAILRTSGVDPWGSWLYDGRGSHNVFLGIAAETGLIGLLLFVWLSWCIVKTASKSGVGAVLFSIVAAYLAQSLFLDILLRKWFWLTAAILFGFAHWSKKNAEQDSTTTISVSDTAGRAG